MGRKLESKFQADCLKELRQLFPGCLILKNDSGYLQGIPDILILFQNRWAMLEFKRSANERTQPNQEYYVEQLNDMSFAAFIHPENKRQIFDALQHALGLRR